MSENKWLVSRWMSRHLVSIRPVDPLVDAFELMQQFGIRHVPVVEGGRLVGILSDRDIRRHLPTRQEVREGESAYGVRLMKTQAEAIMTTNPVVVHPGATIQEAAEIFFRQKFGALPVVSEERLVGMLTADDALWAYAEIVREILKAGDLSFRI